MSTYVLTDEQYLQALIWGAANLGFLPGLKLDAATSSRVDEVRAEPVENGVILKVWLRVAGSLPVPPPDPAVIQLAIAELGDLAVPSVKVIANWTRQQLEEVARWAVAAKSGNRGDLPSVLDKPRRARRARGSSEPPPEGIQ
jgi:hypothetical protein